MSRKSSSSSDRWRALDGLYARAVIVLDEDQKVVYSELVSDITLAPHYNEALKFIERIGLSS